MAAVVAGACPAVSKVAGILTRVPMAVLARGRAAVRAAGRTGKMPNGQFHQKNQKKRRYGVKIKNPLRLPVVARITCETGAIRSGAMDGKETTRTIGPNDEVFISTKGSCELDIEFSVIRYDEVGNTVRLGKAEGDHVDHQDSMGKKGKVLPGFNAIKITTAVDVLPAIRFASSPSNWTIVAEWRIPVDSFGRLNTVSFTIQPVDPGAKGNVWIEIRDDRLVPGQKLLPRATSKDTTIEFKKSVIADGGQRVVILGRAKEGIVRVTGTITGEQAPSIAQTIPTMKKAPAQVTEEKKEEPAQEEEVKITTLGDRFRDLEREEVKV